VRRIYGVLETQFRNAYEKAAQAKGITGENLMAGLERRLDSVIYRMGFGTSRNQARQIVRHGHIQVNGRKVDIPSFQVKVGDEVEVREPSKKNPTILAARDATAHAPAPNWIDVDREGLKGRIQSLPKRDELVQIQLNEQLIVELYSK
jgi:small subunit ribosomal protein S4